MCEWCKLIAKLCNGLTWGYCEHCICENLFTIKENLTSLSRLLWDVFMSDNQKNHIEPQGNNQIKNYRIMEDKNRHQLPQTKKDELVNTALNTKAVENIVAENISSDEEFEEVKIASETRFPARSTQKKGYYYQYGH